MCITTLGMHEFPQLFCNAEESDTRVWLHVVHSAGNKKHVYHIGRLLEVQGGYDIYVQMSSVFPRAEITAL